MYVVEMLCVEHMAMDGNCQNRSVPIMLKVNPAHHC